MGILKVVEWKDNTQDTLVYKVDLRKDNIHKGSMLTVRDSQAVVFADRGKMADVFLPGTYKLDTDSIPLITAMMSWKYGFENPFKSDIYFVNTKQFTSLKWGTTNPIIIRDKEYGAIRVRGFGSYSFRVSDPYLFMKEITGTVSSFKTSDITNHLRSIVVTNITDAIGESDLTILDMAGNLLEFGETVKESLNPRLSEIGVTITQFNFESFTMPEELEKALDESTRLNMLGRNIDTYTRLAQADALKEAAKNPGMQGSTMGAGIGMGMGVSMGNMFANNMNQSQAPQDNKTACIHCNAQIRVGAKFCPECGKPQSDICPNCNTPVKKGAKFCPECGTSLKLVCKKCGVELKKGTKFCPECGEKQ